MVLVADLLEPPQIETPALLTHVSKRPKRATVSSAILCRSSRLATSATMWMASPPCSVISLTTCWSASSLRETSTTWAPSFAAWQAVTRPIPLEAPVITMICRCSGLSFTDIGSDPLVVGYDISANALPGW